MHDYSPHMVEHVLVVLVLAPMAVLAWGPARITRSATTLAFLTYVVLVPLYHLTRLGGIVMRSPGEHATELIIFGLVGIFFWCGPYASDMSALERSSYVALALPVSIFTGIALHSSNQTPFTGMDMRFPMRRPGYITGTLRRPCCTKTMAKMVRTRITIISKNIHQPLVLSAKMLPK